MARPPEFIVPILKPKQWYLMSVPGAKTPRVEPTMVTENEFGVQTVTFGAGTRSVEAMASIGATFSLLVPVDNRLHAAIEVCAATAEASKDKDDQAAAKVVNRWLEKHRPEDYD